MSLQQDQQHSVACVILKIIKISSRAFYNISYVPDIYCSSGSDLYVTHFQDHCFSCLDYIPLPEEMTAYQNPPPGNKRKKDRAHMQAGYHLPS